MRLRLQLSLFLGLSFFLVSPVLATNSYSVDLERGSSQYLSITDGNQTGLDLTDSFTFETWIKPETWASNDNNALLGKWASGNDNASFFLWYDTQSGGTNIRLQVINAGQQEDTLTVSSDLGTGTWKHLAVTWNGSTKTAKFYINGSQVGSDQVGDQVASLQNSSASLNIGYRLYVNYYDGLMDETRIWNVIRSESDINDNKSVELAGTESGLVAYWKYNNDLNDTTSNNNDLTNNNSATFSSDVPFTGETPPASVSSSPPIFLASFSDFFDRYQSAILWIGIGLLLTAIIISIAKIGQAVLYYFRQNI